MPLSNITPEDVQALLNFHARLKIVHEVGGELSKAPSFDAFCLRAVELGCSRLGFDRLGLWFLDQNDPSYIVGSYGIDETGAARDERDKRVVVPLGLRSMQETLDGRVLIPAELPAPLFDDRGGTVGYGWKASAKLWDGEQTIGWISTDNLFSQHDMNDYELELLAIYADSIGHLAAMHRAREELHAERNMLRTIIDSVPDIIFVKDTDNRYMMVNRAFWERSILNLYSEEEVVGKTAYELLPHELAQLYHESDLSVMRSGRAVTNREEPGITNAGTRTFLTSKIPLYDSQGNVVALVGVARDVTEIKEAEAQARELALERERSQTLQEFITNISHDLRTPLTIVNSNLYLLTRTQDSKKYDKYLGNIKEQSERLGRLVDDILTASALEKVTNDSWVPTNINNIITQVEQRMRATALQKRLKTSLNLDAALPRIIANEEHIERLMVNLLQNAIAYTPEEGSISLKTYAQNQHVVVEVSDTGIGISKADLPRIFDHLYRADRARSMDTGGTGVGLAIVRRVVEMHGGSITVKSEPGNGSLFRVSLPVNTDNHS